MKHDMLTGNLGHESRMKEVDDLYDYFHIAQSPLLCLEDYYEKFSSFDRDIVNHIKVIRNIIPSEYSSYDIFTLSNVIKNPLITKIASFLSSLKMCFYDCEQAFSLIPMIKTSQRLSMSDETFRQRMFIQYNVKSIPIDLNLFDDKLKDDHNHVKEVLDIYNNSDLSKDNLLNDPLCSTIVVSIQQQEENHEEQQKLDFWINFGKWFWKIFLSPAFYLFFQFFFQFKNENVIKNCFLWHFWEKMFLENIKIYFVFLPLRKFCP